MSAIVLGSRWDNVLGERVVVHSRPGGRVSFLRVVQKQLVQLDEVEFLAGFKLVDEAEEAKKLTTVELFSLLGDRRALRASARDGAREAVRILEMTKTRAEAAEAELNARIPPRST